MGLCFLGLRLQGVRGASPRLAVAAPFAAALLAVTAPIGAAHAEDAPAEDAPAAPPPAAVAPAAGLPPAIAEISEGDLAWWTGDRATAIAAWRRALERATSPDPADPPAIATAAEAMAPVRLLQLGGNVAPFVHEAKLDAALASCPAVEPWCVLALADWHLFLPAFTGADPARVPATVAPLAGSPIEGPAAARIAVATGDTRALAARPDHALDGMGRGIRSTGRLRPPNPGTWVLGVGIGGAPGAGVGMLVRFAHPDLGWKAHRLDVLAGADTRGGVHASAALRTVTRPALLFGAAGARVVADRWVDGVATPYELGMARLSAAVAPRFRGVGLVVGGSARADWLDGALLTDHAAPDDVTATDPVATSEDQATPAVVAGPLAALTLGDLADDGLRLSADTSFGAYTHVALGADWRAHPPLLGGTLALRIAATHVPTDSPFHRLPTAGGADLLRGLPAGRFRADTLVAGQAEYRHALWGPLHGALFVDTAWVEGPHLTGGAGLRVVLPPDRDNVTRLDVGVGPEGWGVVAAWGDAF